MDVAQLGMAVVSEEILPSYWLRPEPSHLTTTEIYLISSC